VLLEQMKEFTGQPGETSATSVTMAQPVSELVPKTPKLVAAFELLLVVLLVWGNFPYIPFGNTVGLQAAGFSFALAAGQGLASHRLATPKKLGENIGVGHRPRNRFAGP
jgi:hypothetical protein